MRDPLVWVTFTRDFEWHVGLEQRTFTAGKTCQVPGNIARGAIAQAAAGPAAASAKSATAGKAKPKAKSAAPAKAAAKPAAKPPAKPAKRSKA